jgi:hypothetical protein
MKGNVHGGGKRHVQKKYETQAYRRDVRFSVFIENTWIPLLLLLRGQRHDHKSVYSGPSTPGQWMDGGSHIPSL